MSSHVRSVQATLQSPMAAIRRVSLVEDSRYDGACRAQGASAEVARVGGSLLGRCPAHRACARVWREHAAVPTPSR
jgi:hypothetical protein